jgi:gliding motility-associated-like protein
LTGYTGDIEWQYSIDKGLTWISNGNNLSSQSYYDLKETTCYRVIVKNGSFPPDTSPVVCNIIFKHTKAGNISGGGTFCGSTGTGTLQLLGNVGNVLYWGKSTNGGASWSVITNTTSVVTYTDITQNTQYRAIVKNGPQCLTETTPVVSFSINSLSDAGTISPPTNSIVCPRINSNTLQLSGYVGNVVAWLYNDGDGAGWKKIQSSFPSEVFSNITNTTTCYALVQNANCPVDTSNKVSINVHSINPVYAGKDTVVGENQRVILNGKGTGTPKWLPQSSEIENPYTFNTTALPKLTTEYILEVTDANGCVNSDSVLIKVVSKQYDGKITTLFTPNGDGVNDEWFIENINFYPENEVLVYNLNGNLVYNKKSYNNDWRGTYNDKPLPNGTYFYVFVVDKSGQTYKGSVEIISGRE